MKTSEALRLAETLRALAQEDPGLWNIIQGEHEWALYGDACDPLSPAAPERALKAFQRGIYLDVWASPLNAVEPGARVMVAGGGTGRFAQVLVARGLRVELIDASPEAVRRARRHLGESVSVAVGDLTREDTLSGDAYDLLLAVEVACYATDPAGLMSRLRAAMRRGGTLLCSVEASPGALLADRDLASPEAARALLDHAVVTLPGHKHVHYYTRAEARALVERAGFSVRDVAGVCYVPDGPLAALIDAARLDDGEHVAQLMDIERRCRRHPVLGELPRAWAITAVAA